MTYAKGHLTYRVYCEACHATLAKPAATQARAIAKTLAEPVASQARGVQPDAQADATLGEPCQEPTTASARPSPSPVMMGTGEGAAEGERTPRADALSGLMAAVRSWPVASIALLTDAARLGEPMRAVAAGQGQSTDPKARWYVSRSEAYTYHTGHPLDRAAAALDHAFRELNLALHPPKMKT